MFFLTQERPVILGISLSYFWLEERTRQLNKQLHFGRVCLHTLQTQGSFCYLSGGKSKGQVSNISQSVPHQLSERTGSEVLVTSHLRILISQCGVGYQLPCMAQ